MGRIDFQMVRIAGQGFIQAVSQNLTATLVSLHSMQSPCKVYTIRPDPLKTTYLTGDLSKNCTYHFSECPDCGTSTHHGNDCNVPGSKTTIMVLLKNIILFYGMIFNYN